MSNSWPITVSPAGHWPPTQTPPPPRVIPPTPVNPPVPIGTIPPVPVGGPPPPPPDTTPPQYRPGMWSDGWAVVRQTGGTIVVTLSSGNVVPFDIRRAGEQAPDIVNQILGVIGLAARATTVEPWPPARQGTAQRTMGVNAMSAEPSIADVLARIQVLIVNSEQVNARLAAIEQHLAGVATEQPPAPPAPPADPDAEFWQMFLSSPDPDPETYPAEVLTVYDRSRVLMQLRAEHGMDGKRFVPAVPTARQMEVIRSIFDGSGMLGAEKLQDVFRRHGVSPEAAVYAILSGRVEDLFSGSLGARAESQIAQLGGHDASWFFTQDTRGFVTGGGPGQGAA